MSIFTTGNPFALFRQAEFVKIHMLNINKRYQVNRWLCLYNYHSTKKLGAPWKYIDSSRYSPFWTQWFQRQQSRNRRHIKSYIVFNLMSRVISNCVTIDVQELSPKKLASLEPDMLYYNESVCGPNTTHSSSRKHNDGRNMGYTGITSVFYRTWDKSGW